MLLTHSGASTAHHGAMREMFAARKRVFVDLLGWDLPVLADRYEIDQYDNAWARYLILSDIGSRHLASARLLPTTRPHILDQLFPQLCDQPPPSGETILEITRFCLDRDLRAPERRLWRNALIAALVQYALEHGITAYTGVAEQAWLEQIFGFGWHAEALGKPQRIGTMTLGALRIEITPETPALLAANGILPPAECEKAEAA